MPKTMNARLQKEFRSIAVPTLLAIVGAILMPLGDDIEPAISDSDLGLSLFMLLLKAAPFLFYVPLAIAAATAYGAEFQYRTLPLLLSQPISRSRIWREKFATLAIAVIIPGVVYFVANPLLYSPWARWFHLSHGQPNLFTRTALFAGAFLLATVCSAGFWTLLSRSTLGGMVLNAASQCAVFCGLLDLASHLAESGADLKESHWTILVVSAAILYSLIFQWLGWRKFVRLQLRFAMLGEGMARSESFSRLSLDLHWLRCGPRGRLLNLLRKEVWLNKATFVLAGILVLCWTLTAALLFLLPRNHRTFEMIFDVVSCIYVPLFAVVAGATSLGEEKSLGLNTWQLTLPIRARRQWTLKLAVSGTIMLLLGLVFPWLLSLTVVSKLNVGLYLLFRDNDNGLELIVAGCTMIFLISFWSSTMLNSTVAAALATTVGFPVLCACALFGVQIGTEWREEAAALLYPLLARFHFSLGGLLALEGRLGIYLAAAFVAAILLVQSFLQFRRPQTQKSRFLLRSLLVTFSTFALVFCFGVLNSAAQLARGVPQAELMGVLPRLPEPSTLPTPEHPQTVTLQELEGVGLTPATRQYLKDATISVQVVYPLAKSGVQTYQAVVKLPHAQYTFPYYRTIVPSRVKQP
jgi:hypothetical protein